METLIDASKEVGLEVNTEKTKYMLLSRHQNAGQSHDIKIANKCFENVAKFRYLGALCKIILGPPPPPGYIVYWHICSKCTNIRNVTDFIRYQLIINMHLCKIHTSQLTIRRLRWNFGSTTRDT
jgi:hypothetical protein